MRSDISCALASIERDELRTRLGIQVEAGVVEGAARARDHRERSAQVVRDRCEERVAQAFRLDGNARDLGLLGQLGPLDREGDLPGEGFEEVALFGQQQTAPLGWSDREYAERAASTRQRQVLGGSGGKGVGTESRRLAVIEHPLGDRQIGASERSCRRCASRVMQAPVGVRHQQRSLACKGFGDMLDGDLRERVEAARGGELAAHRIEQRGPSFAGAGDPGLCPHVGHQAGRSRAPRPTSLRT